MFNVLLQDGGSILSSTMPLQAAQQHERKSAALASVARYTKASAEGAVAGVHVPQASAMACLEGYRPYGSRRGGGSAVLASSMHASFAVACCGKCARGSGAVS